MQIYIYRGGERGGPYTPEQVREGLAIGTFQHTDLAWRSGSHGLIPIDALLTGQFEYRCAHCGSTLTPGMFRRISQGGWIVFAVLLLLCFPLSLLGFLMKEEYSVCPSCGAQRTLN